MSIPAELEKLSQLHQTGALTDAEFQQTKRQLFAQNSARSGGPWRDLVLVAVGACFGGAVVFVFLFGLGLIATSFAKSGLTSGDVGTAEEWDADQLVGEFASEDVSRRNKAFDGKMIRLKGSVSSIDSKTYSVYLSRVRCKLEASSHADFAKKVEGLSEGTELTIVGRFGEGSHIYTPLGNFTNVFLYDCVIESRGPTRKPTSSPPVQAPPPRVIFDHRSP